MSLVVARPGLGNADVIWPRRAEAGSSGRRKLGTRILSRFTGSLRGDRFLLFVLAQLRSSQYTKGANPIPTSTPSSNPEIGVLAIATTEHARLDGTHWANTAGITRTKLAPVLSATRCQAATSCRAQRRAEARLVRSAIAATPPGSAIIIAAEDLIAFGNEPQPRDRLSWASVGPPRQLDPRHSASTSPRAALSGTDAPRCPPGRGMGAEINSPAGTNAEPR